MNRWLDGWMHGWLDGWMDGWMQIQQPRNPGQDVKQKTHLALDALHVHKLAPVVDGGSSNAESLNGRLHPLRMCAKTAGQGKNC